MKKEQAKTPIWTKLYEYANSRVVYFDVPGHKKIHNANKMSEYMIDTFKYDINSSPDVDNLAHPEGVISQAHKLLAKAFGSDDAYILTNGTTQGIHTLIASSVYPGQKILLPRNSHKSAINGIILAGGIPVFINPTIDLKFGISHNIALSEVKKAFRKNPDIAAMLILNPTYFGVVTNLKQIANFCKEHHITLITDEAHGAHFTFHPSFPKSGMQAGADGAALSFHKTLGSLTQSSVLLWNESKGIQTRYIWQWNSILTSTSPSFLLMASVDATRSKMACKGKEIYDEVIALSKYARAELAKIEGIEILGKEHIGFPGAYKLDETKLVIRVDDLGYTGFEIYEELRTNYNIQLELSEVKVVMAIVTFADTKATIDILVKAFDDISKNKKREIKKENIIPPFFQPSKRVLSPREAIAKAAIEIEMKNAIGRIAADSVMYYPPGIPLILPGEVITQEIVDYYAILLKEEVRVISAASTSENVLVIRDLWAEAKSKK